MKTILLKFILLFAVVASVSGQVSYASKVQESSLVKDEYNLFFIDFWATWCGPCSYATTHINQIRDRFPSQLYVATMSQEQPDLIRKYLKVHPNTLDVFSDAKGATFKKYAINVLPSGILFNASGKILWQGNPADFSAGTLSRYLRSNRRKAAVNTIFKKVEAVAVKEVVAYQPKKDFELKVLGTSYTNELTIKPLKDYTYFEGSLKAILAYANQTSQSQISTNDTNSYGVYLKNDLSKFLKNLVLSELKLKQKKKNEVQEVLLFDVSNARLWDSNQIDWKDNELNYLLTDEDIEADNMTVNAFFIRIANALEMPYAIKGSFDEDQKHDWQVHYKYFEFMQSGLEDGFGISLNKQNVKVPVYLVLNK